jgi:universal stress protein E
MTWRKILLNVLDPQSIEPHVLAKTAQLARALDADLDLFHSVYDSNTARPGRLLRIVQADITSRVDATRRHLERAADSLREQSVRVRTSVRWDYPAPEATIRHVLRSKPDLLIAPSSRKARTTPITLTYSDFRLLQACPCPVLIIKTANPYQRNAIVAALDPPDAPAKSPTIDELILSAAGTLSTALDTPVHACHAAPTLLIPLPGTAKIVAAEPQRQAEHLEKARRKVRALTDDYVLPTRRVHVAQGIPELLVGSLAKQTHADMVVMGAVSLPSSKGILLGRIAERLLNGLDSDVLVVKPPGYRSPVSRQSIRLVQAAPARGRATAAAS